MTARGRALAILTGLAVFVAGWVTFVAAWSGPAGLGPDGRGAGVAGARAAKLDALAPGGTREAQEREKGGARKGHHGASGAVGRSG